MPSEIQLGQRFLLPVLVRDHIDQWHGGSLSRDQAVGSRRTLWVYVTDPTNIEVENTGARLEIPYEPLKPGPVGARFRVESSSDSKMLEYLGWNSQRRRAFQDELVDLDEAAISSSGGYPCSTGSPQFAAQMVYAVCQRVYQTFGRALGREPTFGQWQMRAIEQCESVQLKLVPHALEKRNAWYDSEEGSLKFGFFKVLGTDSEALTNGCIQQFSLSHDVITHELVHAILDGMRSHFLDDTNLDVPAFHEGFSDAIALLHHFALPMHVRQAIESTGSIWIDSLIDLAPILGEPTNRPGGSALGSAKMAMETAMAELEIDARQTGIENALNHSIPLYSDTAPDQRHERGSIFLLAIVDAFLRTFKKRARNYRRLSGIAKPTESRGLPGELIDILTIEVTKLAEHYLGMLIRAVDYCPPVDITFSDYVRALITADMEVMPVDQHGYRGELIRAFRRRGVHFSDVLDTSEESLRWGRPVFDLPTINELAFSKLRLNDLGSEACDKAELLRWGNVFEKYVFQAADALQEFGIVKPANQYQSIVIESMNVFARLDEAKRIQRGMIIEVTQQRCSPNGNLSGGATVILDNHGAVRYVVRKRVNSVARRKRQRAYR